MRSKKKVPVIQNEAETDRLLATLLETSPASIIVHDFEGNFLYFNQKTLNLHGYTREEFLKLKLQDLDVPESAALIKPRMEEIKRRGELSFEVQHFRKDGTKIPLLVNINTGKWGGKDVMLSAATDITQQKWAEQEKDIKLAEETTGRARVENQLHKSEELFHSLVKNIPDVIWTSDENGNTHYISESVTKIFGYSPEEIVTTSGLWFSRIHCDDIDGVKKAYEELIKHEKLYDIEYRLQRKDKAWIWVHDRAANVYKKGNIRYVDGMFRDITEHKRVEEALQKSEAYYRSIFENSLYGIGITGPDLKFQQVNIAFCRILEYDPEDLINKKNILDITYPEDRSTSKDILEKLVRKELDHFIVEKRYVAKSRKIINAINFWRGIYDVTGRYMGGSVSILDITDRKLEEEELRHHRDHLEELVAERTSDLEVKNTQLAEEIAIRKRVEEALLKSEKQFKTMSIELETILDHIPAIIFSKDLNNRYLHVNKFLVDAQHTSKENLIGKSMFDLFPKDEAQAYWDADLDVARNKKPLLNIEEPWTTPDGRKWVTTSKIPIFDENGNVHTILGMGIEITERKRAEEALRESERTFRTLAESSPNMIFIIQGGRIVYANRRCVEVIGYTQEEYADPRFDFISLIAPDDREKILMKFQQHIAGEEIPPAEFAVLSKGGMRVEAIYGSRLIIYHGKNAILGVFTDITQRKQAEEALRESEARLKDAQALGRIGNWEFDIVTQKIIWSEQTYKLYDRDPALGPPTAEEEGLYYHIDLAQKIKDYARLAEKEGKSYKYDLDVRLPNGKLVYFSATMQPIKDAQGRVAKLFGTVQDITEQKKIEQERQVLLEKVMQVSDLKSNLITQAAHELKTPLTAIMGWGELLFNAKKQGKNLDTTFDIEDIETIVRNAERLNDIITDFLDVGRIESGKFEISKQPIDFNEIIENATRAVEYLVTQKNITISTETAPANPIPIDRRRMEQVIINLLSNAIKYSPERTRVLIKTNAVEFSGRKMFKVQIIDEGYGFTPEELAEAMTPFGKAYTIQEKKRVVQGTGLGLFISHRIVEEHGGTLMIRSEGANKGTQVVILLPLR